MPWPWQAMPAPPPKPAAAPHPCTARTPIPAQSSGSPRRTSCHTCCFTGRQALARHRPFWQSHARSMAGPCRRARARPRPPRRDCHVAGTAPRPAPSGHHTPAAHPCALPCASSAEHDAGAERVRRSRHRRRAPGDPRLRQHSQRFQVSAAARRGTCCAFWSVAALQRSPAARSPSLPGCRGRAVRRLRGHPLRCARRRPQQQIQIDHPGRVRRHDQGRAVRAAARCACNPGVKGRAGTDGQVHLHGACLLPVGLATAHTCLPVGGQHVERRLQCAT